MHIQIDGHTYLLAPPDPQSEFVLLKGLTTIHDKILSVKEAAALITEKSVRVAA